MISNAERLPLDEDVRRIMDKVDWEFIDKEEGGAQKKAYVPSEKSGPTVGTGVDIGQLSKKEVAALLPNHPEIVNKVAPYTGLKGMAAKKVLKQKPLVLSDQEVKVIDEAVRQKTARQLAMKYQQGSGKNFSDLPSEVQTAVVSMIHNVGINGAPKALAQLVNGNLPGLADEIVNFKQKMLQPRRQRESQLVRSALQRLLYGEG